MKKGWYCSSVICIKPNARICEACSNAHRKHPTPEQFRKEYGREYPDDWAVYYYDEGAHDGKHIYEISSYSFAKRVCAQEVICASTLFGKPDDDFEVTE
ncbi:hypothetical protein AGMMS49944_04040 [Spirochaetia bacterium]|nr:hypothetical protein AGMMS49944_04040 [Spirochaetia bacterium]